MSPTGFFVWWRNAFRNVRRMYAEKRTRAASSTSDPERTLTFTGHLEELRSRLIWCIVAWVGFTALAFPLAPKAIALLTSPLEAATNRPKAPRLVLFLAPIPLANGAFTLQGRMENITSDTKHLEQAEVDFLFPNGTRRPIGEGSATGSSFYYQRLTDPIWLIFKAALLLGVILALPVWIYHIWGFVKPGLKRTEVRIVKPLFLMCVTLFPTGVVFAYFLLRSVIAFLLSIHIAHVAPLLDYSRYATFAMQVMVGFGIVFELPVVVLLLAHLGVVNPKMLRKHRPYAYLIIAVIAMVVTPTQDPITMSMMMVPLFGLYELSIWLSYTAVKTAEKRWDV
ncbi:MAG: twin-arginine translocase subunit TatC [Candidatus Sumerlaeota bacterium]|nr:twin-arginine translocase subunit TatC [Candidatus Sumerlaeota bacterium]